MKSKITMVAAAILCSMQIFAQKTTVTANKTTFGIRAGVNFQNINGKNEAGDKLKNDLATAFHAGVNAEIPVGTGIYIQPGVLYTTKGAKDFLSLIDKVKISYIDVPVNLIYKPVLGAGNMVLGFGPYVGFGIGGKWINDGGKSDIEFTNKTRPNPADGPSYGFKRFDAGANFLAGYEFSNRLSFQLNAQLGLLDINSEFADVLNDKSSWRNTGWGISLGYRF